MSRKDTMIEIGIEDAIFFDNPDYDSAIVGYEENTDRIIYDYELMVEYLMNKNGMSYEDAIDFVEYNTVRACSYMGSHAPIIMRNVTDFIDYEGQSINGNRRLSQGDVC